jgi:hypothetical protein
MGVASRVGNGLFGSGLFGRGLFSRGLVGYGLFNKVGGCCILVRLVCLILRNWCRIKGDIRAGWGGL